MLEPHKIDFLQSLLQKEIYGTEREIHRNKEKPEILVKYLKYLKSLDKDIDLNRQESKPKIQKKLNF